MLATRISIASLLSTAFSDAKYRINIAFCIKNAMYNYRYCGCNATVVPRGGDSHYRSTDASARARAETQRAGRDGARRRAKARRTQA